MQNFSRGCPTTHNQVRIVVLAPNRKHKSYKAFRFQSQLLRNNFPSAPTIPPLSILFTALLGRLMSISFLNELVTEYFFSFLVFFCKIQTASLAVQSSYEISETCVLLFFTARTNESFDVSFTTTL